MACGPAEVADFFTKRSRDTHARARARAERNVRKVRKVRRNRRYV